MKKWILLGAVALTVTGCSSSTLGKQEYYDLVHQTAGLSGLQNENIKELGGNICGVFDGTAEPYTSALAAITDSGLEVGPAGALIALSVAQYCPDHLGEVPTP